MGTRSLILLFAACGGGQTKPVAKPDGADLPRVEGVGAKVVADFEKATLTSKDAYVALFDFSAVGEMEILFHRYDLNGRTPISDDEREQFEAEDGTPYPPERERRNVGNFYDFLAQRTVGTGGCIATEPRTKYGKLLGQNYQPLPEGTPPGYETLRTHANEWLAAGGVVRVSCSGGKGGIAVVWTKRSNERGYDLITIYDD